MVIIQNSLHQNKNREEVKKNYPNYPTDRLYFGEVETPYYKLIYTIMHKNEIKIKPLN